MKKLKLRDFKEDSMSVRDISKIEGGAGDIIIVNTVTSTKKSCRAQNDTDADEETDTTIVIQNPSPIPTDTTKTNLIRCIGSNIIIGIK